MADTSAADSDDPSLRPAKRVGIATFAGSIVAEREKAGRPIATADAQIEAICASNEAILATRNTGDFEGAGIDLVNPWDG